MTFHEGKWSLTAPPHIVLRAKRVFPKVSRAQFGTLYLADTDENARDLQWFLERFPMAIADTDRARLTDRANAHVERSALVDRLLAKQMELPPFELALPPRDYQRSAASLAIATGGLLLGDELGVGKTVSGICVLAAPGATPALVVTMTHLQRQWEAEIHRFAPTLKTHILKGTTPYDISVGPPSQSKRERARQEAQLVLDGPISGVLPDVIITNYQKLAHWADTLAPLIAGRTVIFDEAHELRNDGMTKGRSVPMPAKYRAALHLRESAKTILGCTGTPIFNYGDEFYSVMNVIRPDAFGQRDEFKNEWCRHGYTIQEPKAFGEYMRSAGLMLRRTRADVGREIPDLIKIPHHIDADLEALDRVSKDCAELARTILAQGGSGWSKHTASEELSNKLRQATGIAKAPYVADFVKMLLETEQNVLLFGWHREVFSIWMDRLKDFDPVMFTGSESVTQKEKAKKAFVEGSARVLIMSLRAGAGIDGLQKVCNVGVFGELDWAYAVHHQGGGRLHRDGQDKSVLLYFLMSEFGADPIIVDVLGLKRDQLEGVINPNAVLDGETFEVDGERIKKLALGYLQQRGLPIPDAARSEGA